MGTAALHSIRPMNDIRSICLLSLAMCLERALMVAALEAATSLILELEFGLSTDIVGIYVGLCFVCGVPLILLLTYLQRKKHVSDTVILSTATVASVVATLLLFEWPVVNGLAPVLISDLAVVPMGYIANGICDGFALREARPGTMWSQENIIIA